MTGAVSELKKRYRRALAAYTGPTADNADLADPLGLGRALLVEGGGLIELLTTHQAVLAELITGFADASSIIEIVTKAEEFLIEVLAPFEMTHRGWHDVVGRLRQLNETLEDRVTERSAALRQSEQRFRDIAEVSGDWIWETDREHRFTLLYGRSTDQLPLRTESFYGKTRWEVAGSDRYSDPQNDEHWMRHKADLDAHLPFRNFRYAIATSSGGHMFVTASGKPMFDDSGEFLGYRGTASDETAIIEAQRRAQEAEGALRRVFDTSMDLIVITDARGTLIRISPSATFLLGYDPAELIGRSGVDIVYHEDLNNTRKQMRTARRTGTAQNFECRYVHKQGSTLTFWWKGVWSEAEHRYFFIGRDITERKQTEQRLRESEDQLKRAQRLARMGCDMRDLRTGEREWSEETYRIFGVSREKFEVTLESVSDLIHPDDRALAVANRDRTAAGACPPPFEYRIIRPDGEIRHVYREWALIRDEAGKPAQILGTIQDVTERRRTEAQLRQAQKMEAIGSLTGGMAHDFNNLLGIIVGNLDLARERTGGDEELSELVDEALHAAWRGADLTRRLLAFARRQPLQPARLDINELIDDTVRLLRRLLGEDIELAFTPADRIWSVIADPAQLEASLTNLATNARDAMPGGGRLSITTANTRLDADYAATHPDVTPGEFAMIEVSDTGIGMSPEMLSQIFEPFFTTKEPGKGTGLGLSMVFGFLRQSGGHVNVYSEKGVGTIFRLYLPRSHDEAAPSRNAPEPDLPVRTADECVLVVEDNLAMRRIAVRQLSELGYRVLEAERAAAALEILQREDIDLLLSDIVMPGGLDGVELARRARERWPTLKIVLTSGFPEVRTNNSTELLESLRLLSKPYSREQLARVLREALDG